MTGKAPIIFQGFPGAVGTLDTSGTGSTNIKKYIISNIFFSLVTTYIVQDAVLEHVAC